jgi:hypothetical protein
MLAIEACLPKNLVNKTCSKLGFFLRDFQMDKFLSGFGLSGYMSSQSQKAGAGCSNNPQSSPLGGGASSISKPSSEANGSVGSPASKAAAAPAKKVTYSQICPNS